MDDARRTFIKRFMGGGALLIATGGAAFAWLDRKLNPTTSIDYALPGVEEAGTRAALTPTPACGDPAELTVSNSEGPFYTPRTPRRANLREPDIAGQPLVVEGRVLTPACVPLAGAVLDFWSCDGDGHYDNEGFRLRGHQFTDAEGRYRLETVKPASYEQFMVRRTPHIHVKVKGRDTALLTTQLYFPGEPDNEGDILIDERLVMDVAEQDDGSLLARFDFVLA